MRAYKRALAHCNGRTWPAVRPVAALIRVGEGCGSVNGLAAPYKAPMYDPSLGGSYFVLEAIVGGA